ncbi:Uncharacterized membrane-anchored protein YitT, contains DUF161 and DUF2179 domains [Robiginitalea myxolifaciens]|uniref:Uncharacterized membrane-anchored protein YitT, contains DUF161 and DUF2179 domains n=1 Tax=Robiginitalea myxolifaciens TaxID=400055 RepID=A0A1I6G8E9_9FLAO|nr:YitT family protein [Robiginitalea myxolifaciens]SFR38469.1 Uncharacterized membrane-anchored protein YitT, contains DUF161 and DUF2179 domains [Robiginitalea myxolifaciens]
MKAGHSKYRFPGADILLIIAGVFSAAFGLEGFLLPNQFIDGGATGISLLITEVTQTPLSLMILIVNAPFILLGFRVVGKWFALKTMGSIALLALVLFVFDFPEITEDKVLVSVFGGFFLGAGIGLSIRGGSVLDGTEILAIFLSRRSGLKIGDIIILVNIIIFLTAAYFLSIEAALYSMLAYLAASKTLDFVVDGLEEYTAVTIISTESEAVRLMIVNTMKRGLTLIPVRGGYREEGEHTDYQAIYTVITRLEIYKLYRELDRIDPDAFVVMSRISDTRGGMIKKRTL